MIDKNESGPSRDGRQQYQADGSTDLVSLSEIASSFIVPSHPDLSIKEVAECRIFGCRRCESLDGELPTSGTLYMNPSMATTQVTLRSYLRSAQIPFSEPFPSIVAATLIDGTLGRMSLDLPTSLTESELQNCSSLLVEDGVIPTISDLVRMQPLSNILARLQGSWLTEVLRESRIFSVFQPIVYSSDPTQVFGYECLVRGRERNGGIISPAKLFAMARSGNLLYYLDRTARLTAIRDAHKQGLQETVFINFDPQSVDEPSHCLQATIRTIAGSNLRPDQIVFEVVESSQTSDIRHLLKLLSYYRDRGLRVALDDMGAGYSSLNLLTQVRPDFVKLDIELIRDVDSDPYKARVAAKIMELAASLGIETIAEGIETEGELNWVRGNGADYVQGFYIARPATPPPLRSDPSHSA